MSMLGPKALGRRSDEVGEIVASFPTYEAAQKAVSSLIAGEVPARHIAIVGQGLRSVERITGRLGYATAARSGAVNGMLLGLFFSAILVLGTPSVPIQAFVGVIFVGVAIGMLFSIITYSFVRRRRDYASVMQVLADHYEVTVERDSVGKARQVLGHRAIDPRAVRPAASAPSAPSASTPTSSSSVPPRVDEEPPRYGERITQTADAAPEVAEPVKPVEDEPDADGSTSSSHSDADAR